MSDFLLDTNIVSDLVRNPQGAIARQIAEIGEDRICTSIIVVAEIRYGAARKASARLNAQIETVLGALSILPFEQPADQQFGDLRAALELRGLPIGAYDMLIAAHALAIGATLVTDNEREFRRVEGLRVVNWLR